MPTEIQRLLPFSFATEAEAARRLRMSVGFGKMGCLCGSVFAVFFLAIGHHWGALVVAVCTAGFAANLLVLRKGRLALAGHLYALLLTAGFVFLTAIEGGLAGHSIAWLACVPICACLFSGPQAGIRWCFVCLGAVGVFSVAACLGYSMPLLYPARWTPLVSAAGYLTLTAFMSTLGLLSETSRQRAFHELRLTLDELAGKNSALSESMSDLSRSEARFRMLFENSALGVALLDRDGRVQLGNTRLTILLNLSTAENFDLAALVCVEERAFFLKQLRQQQAPASPSAFSRAIPTPGGKPEQAGDEFILELPSRGKRVFRFFLSCVPKSGQVCAFFDDVTSQRALERMVIQQEKSALLDTLIGGVAHELNNKLTPVAGYAEMLLRQSRHIEQSDEILASVIIIRNGAIEAGKIISQLLQLSRPLSLEMQICDLRQIVEAVCPMLMFRLRNSSTELRLELSPQGLQIRADAAQIKQVLLNLALNALDAMEGCPTRVLSIKTEEADRHAVLAVSDTGCGISAEQRGRIFDPFFTTKGNQGTGLGLSVCASIVKIHGGQIEVETTPGAGTRFTVALPLDLHEATGAVESASSPDVFCARGGAAARRARISGRG